MTILPGEYSLHLRHRPRRNRKNAWSRALVRENHLRSADLIWPIFIVEGQNQRQPISSMPGVERLTIDLAIRAAKQAVTLDIPAIALFPNIDKILRDEMASEATNPDSLICRALLEIKAAVPDIGLIADVALDPFTSHGHDGIMDGATIINDQSVHILAKQALNYARSGADIIAPSDMMDGRIGFIRETLDDAQLQDVQIMAYAAKYASAFYGPFREAVGTNNTLITDKCSYQMDPGNVREALQEVALDIEEGADMVMVKPGMPYLDIVSAVAGSFDTPVFAYQVSGEYAMIEAAAQNGWIDSDKAMMESLLAFKRAGARGILTYFAPRAAKLLHEIGHSWR